MRTFVVAGIIVALSACGGSSKRSSGPPAGSGKPTASKPAQPDPDALYKACGLWTTKDVQESGILNKDPATLTPEEEESMSRDPAAQTPKDAAACLAYTRWALDDRSTVGAIVAAGDISYGLCFGQAIGEACYLKALHYQLGVWGGSEPLDDIANYLKDGCSADYQPACKILATGKDEQGRTWAVAPGSRP